MLFWKVFADNRNGSAFPFPTRVTQEPPDSFTCPAGTTTDADVFIVKSIDGGLTWSPPLRVNQDDLANGKDQWFPFVAVTSDGRVDVVFYDRRDDQFNRLTHVYLARSGDGGITWTDARVSDVPSNMNWAFEDGLFIGDYQVLFIFADCQMPWLLEKIDAQKAIEVTKFVKHGDTAFVRLRDIEIAS